ncbi:MAG: hypothetical protein ACOC0P_05050, partial [Planctomycetota bacterium]
FRSHAKNRRLAAALPGLMYTWLRPGDLAAEPAEVTDRLQACHDAMSQPAWMTAPVPDRGESADEARAAAGGSVDGFDRSGHDKSDGDSRASSAESTLEAEAAQLPLPAHDGDDGDDGDDRERTSFSIDEGRPELVSDPEVGPVNIRFGDEDEVGVDRDSTSEERFENLERTMHRQHADADPARKAAREDDSAQRETPDASETRPGSGSSSGS